VIRKEIKFSNTSPKEARAKARLYIYKEYKICTNASAKETGAKTHL
jgi:hypothetical protein